MFNHELLDLLCRQIFEFGVKWNLHLYKDCLFVAVIPESVAVTFAVNGSHCVADVLELKADPDCNAVGVVIEAKLDKGRGPVATVLIKHGKLHRGDHVVIGDHTGKIRAMTDHAGKRLKELGPAGAAELIGLDGVPNAGDQFHRVDSGEVARAVAEHRVAHKQSEPVTSARMTLDQLMKKMSGDAGEETAKVVVEQAEKAVKKAAAPAKVAVSRGSQANVSVSKTWAVEIKDIKLLALAVAEGRLPITSIEPNMRALTAAGRAGGVEKEVDGVRYFQRVSTTVR